MKVKLLAPDVADSINEMLKRVPEMTTDMAVREIAGTLRVVVDAITYVPDAPDAPVDTTLYLVMDDGDTHITDGQGQDITVSYEEGSLDGYHQTAAGWAPVQRKDNA